MSQHLSDSRLANFGANLIYDAFDAYQTEFKEITRRAKMRFENCDWHGGQADAKERLNLYGKILYPVVYEILSSFAERIYKKLVWASMKAVFSGMITHRNDRELAETFFNSVTRRIFTTVGVDHQIEFVDSDFESPPEQTGQPIYRTFQGTSKITSIIKSILSFYKFSSNCENLNRDIQAIALIVKNHLSKVGALRIVEHAEMVKSVFYRGKGAYIVGQMFSGSHIFPFVLALINTPQGIKVDAVILTGAEVSILFSYTRSYFHVDIKRQHDLITFLKSVMPRKRIAELYIAIGHHKHGKTELYRDLLHHLASSEDKFEIARGKKGMVMTVFTLPGYDLVFKLIRDRFSYPKTGTRQEVMSKYRLVFKRDRAGRLVDAQEFEYLQFERNRFSENLLQELQKSASQTVSFDNEFVIIKHTYVERRIIPLDIYVREAAKVAAESAVIDYGNAIKDLMKTNIFPGDMMLKNFGVTRNGRVIFYDYDELCLLTQCNFREIPQPRYEEDELADEPWFTIGENDIFPNEFKKFLELHGELKKIFYEHHADLFEVGFWQNMQHRIENGEIIDILPYKDKNRLHHHYHSN
jgi:isocitrate dehydrogenase kinase/phosphatase